MRLYDLLKAAGLEPPRERAEWEIEVKGISSDSRTVQEGELFVALRGLHHDGSSFVGRAFSRGACFAICERVLEGERIQTVRDSRDALARLWDAWYGHPSKRLSLIGVTGTNGKTSTATMLHWILRCAGKHAGLIGTVECRMDEEALQVKSPDCLANMTTPDPAELYTLLDKMSKMGAEYVVMEVTSHALALRKVSPLFFSRAVFTNLSVDHLDMHGDMEAYFLEKRKLFSRCEQAIISGFSPYGERLLEAVECPTFELSRQTVRNFASKGVEGISFDLVTPLNGQLHIDLPVAGDFFAENAGLAALCAISLGVDKGVIQDALGKFPGVRGRMERLGENALGVSVFLDYAHTPDALRKLLETVRRFSKPCQRILLLFGCGGDRDRGKRREMGSIASRLSDLVILTSDNSRGEEPTVILEEILRGMDKEKPYLVIEDRREAIAHAVELARPGDILILAGKGHEAYEIKGGCRLPFCEREIVQACINERVRRENHEDQIV